MKKVILSVISIACMLCACTSKNNTKENTCILEVNVDGTTTGTLTIAPYKRVESREAYEKNTIKDSLNATKNTIEIDTVQAIRPVTINYNGKNYSTKLFTGVGKYILTINNDSLIVKGAPRHEEFLKIDKDLGISKMENLRYKRDLSEEDSNFKKNYPENLIATIKKYPKNLALAQTAQKQFWNADSETLALVINSFDSSLHSSYFLDPLVKRRENLELVKVGKPAPSFTLKNPEGKDISLTDYKGKYVLIDFWAYWCMPCIATFPELKEIRETYGEEKLALISISTDKNYDKWIEAVDKHKLPWEQVIDDANLKEDIGSKYAVVAIPHLILVSPEGTIVYKHHYEKNLTEELKKILE